jgi:hypothetical protein
MLTIKESNIRYPNHTEKSLNRIDALGRKGIDTFKENDIKFVYEGKADFGISWHGEKVPDVPLNRTILYRSEPPIYNIYFGRNLNKPSFYEKYMVVLSDYQLQDSPAVYCPIPMEFDLPQKYFLKLKYDFLCYIAKNKTFGIFVNSLLPSLHKYKQYSNMKLRKKYDKLFCERFKSNYNSYGKGWNKACYQGKLANHENFDVMASHKFTLGIENCSIPGYVCEKVIYPMFCGSIPVYYGPSDIYNYVSKDCFINLRLVTDDDICQYLTDFSNKDYLSMIKNIKRYITTEESFAFSSVHYAQTLIDIMEGWT